MTASRKRLVISVVCGIAAALLMTWYVLDIRAQAASLRQEALVSYGGEQVEVFVATRDIAIGETLNGENVTAQSWLVDLLPEGALTNQADVHGKTVAVPLLRNEPVVAVKLGDLVAPVSVPDDLCAVSFPSEDVLAVGGAISAGSEVNVYAVGASSVVLLGQDVLVLETSNGTRSDTRGSGGLFGSVATRSALSWVTLAVAPERVQEYLAASRDQQLYLVLPGAAVPELVSAADDLLVGPQADPADKGDPAGNVGLTDAGPVGNADPADNVGIAGIDAEGSTADVTGATGSGDEGRGQDER